MPELPEVETIRRGLTKRIKDFTIRDVEVRVRKLFHGDEKNAQNAKIINIWRRAKMLGMELDNDYSILVHLKMTGQLVFCSKNVKDKIVGGHPQKAYNEPLPHKHTHIIINFTDDSRLFFNDLRKFGWMKIIKTTDVLKDKYRVGLGAEPLGKKFIDHKSEIIARIKKSRISIKTWLMDQKNIAGLGNIYSDEVLYFAGIRPDRKGIGLTDREINKIFSTIPEVLKKAIKCGGTSDSTFVGVDGERGDYLKCAAVYHRDKDPKGHKVEKKKINGRTAHFCSKCQA